MGLLKDKAKENLAELIKKFEGELARIKDYNEEATKISFIQPLLKDVLGWDVNDNNEVSPEEKVSRDRVDYGLKVEGKTKIFIEAKPPKAKLDKYIEQAVKYGYNMKDVPIVVLTDFEGLKIFDVTLKPDPKNRYKGLKHDLHWSQYLERFDTLWLISKESAVNEEEFNKLLFAKPKDRLTVDKAILDDLKLWRELLAKNIFKNNPELFHLDDKEKGANFLREITQRILDRIIFMRFCEDRNLTHQRSLREIIGERADTVGTKTMLFFKAEFQQYNIIFDSDLFSPKDWENDLKVDFKVMREIVSGTYSPYLFDVIPIDVLGNIYEQYLGYTIRLTDHQVRYDLKPEVRKAGGVYYTPEYIVDYIVKNTVGKLLQELPPDKVKRLKILDPACGSGSFLIRAYEEMLNYYKEQNELTIQKKSKILREHIFGVDIDSQAVEVTKLSLMLKMLDGEHGLVAGHELLPMLDKNIKCGNSLISGSQLELKKYFGDDFYNVSPFNWEDEFKEIMKDGGFDVVIGNPPYGASLRKSEKEYFTGKYEAQSYQLDSYLLFLERSMKELLNRNGFYGMIIPNPWLTNILQERIRKFVTKNSRIVEIVHFHFSVFPKVTVDTEIVILQKATPQKWKTLATIVDSLNAFQQTIPTSGIKRIYHEQSKWQASEGGVINIFLNVEEKALAEKCELMGQPVNLLYDINVGIKPYQVGKGKPPQKRDTVQRRIYDSNKPLDSSYRPCLRGSDIGRYKISPLKTLYIKYGPWLAEPRPAANFDAPVKIFMRQTGDSLIAAIDTNSHLCLNNMHVLVPKKTSPTPSYVLGILNSRLLNWYYHTLNPEVGEALAEVKKTNVAKLPIRTIDFSNPAEKKLHDELVELVELMLDLNKKVQTAKGSEREQIQRQIEKTDAEIDGLVYRLYGITEDEKKIIEGDM